MTGVVVIGAGVSGLTTAICLAEAGAEVRVWAERPPLETTSALAGAMWGPSFQQPVDKTPAWTEQSLRDFTALAGVRGSGVRMAPVLTVGELPPVDQLPPQATMIPGLRSCTAGELPDGYPAGFRATMPVIDMPVYLRYLTGRLAEAGVEIEMRRASALSEAGPVVVNCAGLGARELAGDDSVRPMLGQLVAVANPGLDEVFLELAAARETTQYVPHHDRVVCGGIAVPDVWDTTPDPGVTERILERCGRVEPRLREAKVLDVWVGLRPDRPAVRVEAEGGVVHNYGHGGNGVSLSWGCAREAAALTLQG
ncbi:FAD-dependent oxidoreductase [Nonomuraea sediminis]|uniref:FAD-dependent oxidoreductase n=1 Tax=Nonomuraea sediminis TaxID=2835864 RepID=UPI001BDCA1F7|nr:FAD-dependent oxidoreductase [Nonomuraea sediminis]